MHFFRFFNPEVYQGSLHKKNCFEGWYYKLLNTDSSYVLSVIPGISFTKDKPHCFIQIIDSNHARTAYIEYPLDSFSARKDKLYIKIGENTFTQNEICLDIDQDIRIKGVLSFYNIIPFPKTVFRRGMMGPFCFVPFMECNHGIVNIRHNIKGSIEINGFMKDFNNGTGYIEKDWGHSFPSSWIWVQSHDVKSNTTFMFSAADIPFIGRRFLGILCFLYSDGKYISVSTYSGAKISSYSIDEKQAAFLLTNRKYRVSFSITRAKGSALKAPLKGLMQRTIEESLNACVTVEFTDHKGRVLYRGDQQNAGLEICGDVQSLFKKYLKF